MNSLIYKNREISLDHDGFLKDITDWSPELAHLLAETQGITLTPAHWEIIELTRTFYARYDMSPNQRPFANYIKKALGPEKASSAYLMHLFPGSPAKLASMIAGIPKPSHCF